MGEDPPDRELNPAAPAPAVASHATAEPVVEIEVDRRAVLLGGIATETCIQCGERAAELLGDVRIPGRFRSIDVKIAICRLCREKNEEAFRKVGNLARVVNGLYVAQLIAFAAGLAGSGSAFIFSAVSVLFVGTLGANALLRRRLLREQPKLLEVKAATVRLRAPRAWARVLADENPDALVRGPEG